VEGVFGFAGWFSEMTGVSAGFGKNPYLVGCLLMQWVGSDAWFGLGSACHGLWEGVGQWVVGRSQDLQLLAKGSGDEGAMSLLGWCCWSCCDVRGSCMESVSPGDLAWQSRVVVWQS